MNDLAAFPADAPLYYELAMLCSRLSMGPLPQRNFHAALVNAGYRVSATHAAVGCLKTDAPPAVVWRILRAWEGSSAATRVAARHRDDPSTIPHAILVRGAGGDAAEPAIDFTVPEELRRELAEAKASSGPHFVNNPGDNWGPGSRASGSRAEHRSKKEARK
jgi:tRNA (guanine26-N2/guanine27-N2)-dimethyltransferase